MTTSGVPQRRASTGLDLRTHAGRRAARVREQRIAAGLTQHALASAMGVSRTTVNRWENGRQGISKAMYGLAMHRLGVTFPPGSP